MKRAIAVAVALALAIAAPFRTHAQQADSAVALRLDQLARELDDRGRDAQVTGAVFDAIGSLGLTIMAIGLTGTAVAPNESGGFVITALVSGILGGAALILGTMHVAYGAGKRSDARRIRRGQ